MPPELLKAHRDNDRAVMAAYGFSATLQESEIVAHLFNLYSNPSHNNSKKENIEISTIDDALQFAVKLSARPAVYLSMSAFSFTNLPLNW